MDEFAITLFERLVDKTFENMSQCERLAFVEKLYRELPNAVQQELLLKLALQTAGVDALSAQLPVPSEGERVVVKMIRMGPETFGPWQQCCRVMNDFIEISDPENLETAPMARMFTGLADETRLKIVKLLSEREYPVDELVRELGFAQSTTSHHLRVLKEAGLIKGDKRGRSVFYSLVEPSGEALQSEHQRREGGENLPSA